MGMFDRYEPMPPVRCPYCGFEIKEWQGKEGPCALYNWRQGVATPVALGFDETADEQCLEVKHRLPEVFWFYPSGVGCRYCPTAGIGRTQEGIWVSTTLVALSDAPFHEDVDLGMGIHQWTR